MTKGVNVYALCLDDGIGPLNDYLRNGESVKKKSERAWNKLNKITSYP